MTVFLYLDSVNIGLVQEQLLEAWSHIEPLAEQYGIMFYRFELIFLQV